jgi:TPR repeat protein
MGTKSMPSPETPKPPDDLAKAAETGDAEAQSDLGRWYAENLPATPYAQMWFERAAGQGLPKAFHNLGVSAIESGDRELAIEWFRKAVAADWSNSILPLGKLLELSGDISGALEVLDRGARRGVSDSQEALSDLIVQKEIESHYHLAFFLTERAAQQGSLWAQSRLGMIYHEGLGVERNPELAASWFLKAAKRGHPFAQLMIGGSYHLGTGIKVDRPAAMRFLRLSAAQGNEFARAYLPAVEADLTPEERAQLESEAIAIKD